MYSRMEGLPAGKQGSRYFQFETPVVLLLLVLLSMDVGRYNVYRWSFFAWAQQNPHGAAVRPKRLMGLNVSFKLLRSRLQRVGFPLVILIHFWDGQRVRNFCVVRIGCDYTGMRN